MSAPSKRLTSPRVIGVAIVLIGIIGIAAAADHTDRGAVQIASLKIKTQALVAAAIAQRNTSPAGDNEGQRIDAPPAIWRVPGSITAIKDCAHCPDMVVIPAGEFTMGSPQQEGGESQHRVTIAYPFALGRTEVTFDQWDACVADGGCNGYRPSDSGWGRGSRPVVNVSWNDSEAYVRWVSKKTGKSYRLPSEAEWEYAARAGTETPFYFGTAISSDMANYDGTYAFGAKAGLYRLETLPVASFRPNGFGLYDMLGNAWEWTEDCWNDDYTAATPTDGSAWEIGDCSLRVRRGGSWANYPWIVRSAFRNGNYAESRYNTYGFRVARAL